MRDDISRIDPGDIELSNWSEAFSLERRDFLKTLGAGVFVLVTLGDLSVSAKQGRGYPDDINAYLRIREDGRVTIFSGKIEMGQGVMTSLAQMAAEDLGVPLDAIDMLMGDTDLCPYDMGTFGSMSTRFFGPALRAAAAEAREVLLTLAAEHLEALKNQVRVVDGVVFVDSDRSRRVTYAELIRGRQITRVVEEEAVLKAAGEFAVMGKSFVRLDAIEKVTGEAAYAGDIRLPGMLYARILRPPSHDAILRTVDTTIADALPGVTVVNQDGLIAVLHADPESAEKALMTVSAEYDRPESELDEKSIFDHLVHAYTSGRASDVRGDLTRGEQECSEVFEETYLDGYVAHAPMEPHTATAQFKDGRVTVWASTQTPFPDQQMVARATGLPQEDVRIITPYVGGGFGGKTSGLQTSEAARLAMITGRPVQVAWSRAEEFFYDAFRPASVVKIRSGVDQAGRIHLWDYHVYAAGSRGADQHYDAPHNSITVYGGWQGGGSSPHPFAVGAWRAPGAPTNIFAKESQIDIMAAKLGVDPLEFRLENTSDDRLIGVLKTVADAFGWAGRRAVAGRGYGLACGLDAGTYVAHMAEVEVDEQTGEVRVERIVCAQDMGVVVNPDGALMQMEGCITMGLGYTLSEDIRFRGGEILDNNFDTYEIPRFSWLPEIETILVKNDMVDPQGGGEPAIICIGALVANAIFDAVGVRLFQLPLTPTRVREALVTSPSRGSSL
ncbi:molybdopterin cofactor-binding domain-containing protein [Candidatus Zixiibacteriota bacterium]